MAENLYEGMFLVDSARYASDSDSATNEILGLLEKADATVVAHRPWQDGKLAYPIEGLKKGVHFLTYFRMDGGNMPTLNRACQLSDVVVRQLIIKHPPKLFDAMVAALTVPQEEETGEASASGGAKDSTTDKETTDKETGKETDSQ